MKKAKKKLRITTETVSEAAAASGPIPGCPQGYAVYTFVGSRHMQRVGGATCLFPSSGYSSATASSVVSISSALSTQLTGIAAGNPSIAELRFAVCCPTHLAAVSKSSKQKKAKAKAKTKEKEKAKAKTKTKEKVKGKEKAKTKVKAGKSRK